ncbi:MAG TPA: thioredoxin family protein [Tepidisphaeraceae bacterium]|jgi:thiol:disulfide interchange protein|nr:thioredoxin family protein [Tepidisphaeraceae bacterium]
MKKSSRSTFVALLIFLAIDAVIILPRFGGKKEIIPWRTDFAAARAEAARTHRPLFLDFTASWCGPCQTMRRTAWTDPAVAAAMADLVPVQIDIDQQGDLARKFGISSIPALLLLDERGNVLKEQAGLLSPDKFIAWLKSKIERRASGT